MTVEEYKEILRNKLTEKRYHHSLCVAEEAVRLAEKYGCDTQKAFYAGLLHDILKDTPGDEQLQIMQELGIILTEIERSAPKLWHAMAGSAYLRYTFDLSEDIVSAVRYHTTAKPDMTLLEKVLYLADYTSADRDYDGVEEMRRAVEVSMEAALRVALQFTVQDLSARNLPIHPDTFMAYNEIMLKKEEV
ncbi:MAG: bis(5'-nucleosyl)-tetraphosphatase (symmetrical) YqeK [Clostridia bacterium]|nr:bis(5'-nucleosyl)-tetraphosphatase (symmetrical) YqeK [Clostridia bacterium]